MSESARDKMERIRLEDERRMQNQNLGGFSVPKPSKCLEENPYGTEFEGEGEFESSPAPWIVAAVSAVIVVGIALVITLVVAVISWWLK